MRGRFSRFQFLKLARPCARAAVAVFSMGVLSTHPVRAEPGRPFELSWQAPPTCPTSQEVEREIARLIGDASRNRASVRAQAEVTRRDDDWRVQIRIQDGEHVSERSFEGATCRAVTKVASLIIALTIEPNAGTTPETAPPPPRERPEPPQGPSARAAQPAEPPLRAFVAAGPVAELRVLPRIGFGFEIGLGMRLPSLSVELRGGALLPQPTDLPSSAAGGRFSLISAGLRVCARVVPRAPEIFGCAAGFLDRVQAEGYGVTVPGSATALLGTAALGPRVDLPLGEGLRISLAAEATHTFSEANFRLDNVGNVHRTPRWGGSARLHVAWLF
jgi:hypothetical protein